jgi:hypothetical protein
MGFLISDTSNIILDAVLTETGRQFLSRNNGSFSITKFALGDDEIDYSIIEKFGRNAGVAKIEKNTPIFEGITNQGLAQKYKLISVSNPLLLTIPTLTLTGFEAGDTASSIGLGNVTARRKTLTVSQTLQQGTVDVELREQLFSIQMNDMFLQLSGGSSASTDSQGRATYTKTRDDNTTGQSGSRLTLGLEVKSITDTQFAIYGAAQNKQLIKTYVKVQGINTGAVLEFEVRITKNT